MKVAKHKASEADESLTSSDGSESLKRAAELNKETGDRYDQ
jgi:hypothetical protein